MIHHKLITTHYVEHELHTHNLRIVPNIFLSMPQNINKTN